MKRVVAALAMQEKRILITRRSASEKNGGLWEFPGGKVEPGESDEHALSRELREELGVGSTTGCFFASTQYHYGHGAIELVAYFTALSSSDFTLSVHDESRFVSIDTLLNYELSPADIPIAEALMRQR